LGKIRRGGIIYNSPQKPFRKNMRRIFEKLCGKNQSNSGILGKTLQNPVRKIRRNTIIYNYQC